MLDTSVVSSSHPACHVLSVFHDVKYLTVSRKLVLLFCYDTFPPLIYKTLALVLMKKATLLDLALQKVVLLAAPHNLTLTQENA